MAITLTANGDTLELPEDLVWVDELTASMVKQVVDRGIFATPIVHAMSITSGYPITLKGEANSAWITRGDLKRLRAWAKVAGLHMTLDINGELHDVLFDHGDGDETKAYEKTSVVEYSDPIDSDYSGSLTLRFIEASEIV